MVPVDMPTYYMPPGTESWGERYGVIGVVAALSIMGIVLGLRSILNERREDRERVTALQTKLVESGQEAHREALKLIAELQQHHDDRYSALLERHIGETGKYAEALREQSAATTAALSGLVKKISSRGTEP
jgi:hypothetical protein